MFSEENNECTEEDVAATQEDTDTTSALISIMQHEHNKTEKLMRSLGRLFVAFGATFIVSMAIVWKAALAPSPGIIVFGMLTGAFMIIVALIISLTCGFGKKNIMSGHLLAKDIWINMKSHEDIIKSLPRIYLAMSGVILLCCSGCMIAGDVVLSQYSYYEVPYHIIGRPHVFSGCSVIYIASALLSFALAVPIIKQHPKILSTCFMFTNFVGFVAAMHLSFSSSSGPRYVSMVDINQERSDHHRSSLDVGQALENDITLGIILKFASVEIALVFSIFNALLALTFLADLSHRKEIIGKSKLMGILGGGLIISAIVMEIIMVIFSTSLVLEYVYMLQINRSLFVIFCLLTGLQSIHAFYSAGNLRKFTVFVLSLIVAIFSVMTMISIVEFRSIEIAAESAALSDCQGISDTNLFCVYNTTGDYDDYFKDSNGIIYQNVYRYNPQTREKEAEVKPLGVACIPKDKHCDGKADLFIETTTGGYRSGRLQLCKSFLDKSSWFLYRVDPLVPIDEVTCYSNTPLLWLVIAALTILATDIVCVIALIVITFTSLPPAFTVVFNYFNRLFGIVTTEDKLPSETENCELKSIECTTNTDDTDRLYT